MAKPLPRAYGGPIAIAPANANSPPLPKPPAAERLLDPGGARDRTAALRGPCQGVVLGIALALFGCAPLASPHPGSAAASAGEAPEDAAPSGKAPGATPAPDAPPGTGPASLVAASEPHTAAGSGETANTTTGSQAGPDTAVGSDAGGGPEAAPASETDGAPPSDARPPFQQAMPGRRLPADSRAMRNANLSPSACRAEARRRHSPFKRDRRPTPGVATAFRIAGELGGVRFLSGGWSTPYGVLDCRLALTLEDLAPLLRAHGVERVLLGTIYRPHSKLSSGSKSQHSYGLAIDLVGFVFEGGLRVDIERDWQGVLGEPPCGPESRLVEPTPKALRLRNLACDIGRSGYFHYILTPNYNAAHHDHLHLDIKRDEPNAFMR